MQRDCIPGKLWPSTASSLGQQDAAIATVVAKRVYRYLCREGREGQGREARDAREGKDKPEVSDRMEVW